MSRSSILSKMDAPYLLAKPAVIINENILPA
jgi:hypothetical protein